MSLLTEIQYGKVIAGETMSFTQLICGGCGIPFYIPTHRYNTLVETKGSFHCPNGCSRSFIGKTKAEILQEQLDKTKAQALLKEQELQNQFLDELGKNLKLTKQLKRIHKGVCPCCNRSFTNLRQHMATKHPEEIKKHFPDKVKNHKNKKPPARTESNKH